MVRRFFLMVMVLGICCFIPAIDYAQYESKYDVMFANLDSSASNVMFQAMDSMDYDLVYSAIKRAGELKLLSAKTKIKEWLGAANPSANVGKPKQLADMRHIFNISIWAVGRVGNDADAEVFANYWVDITDKESRMYIIMALGEISGSPKAISVLNDLTQKVNDERLANVLLESIEKQKSKSSVYPLVMMGNRPNFSKAFKTRANQLAGKLSNSGK